MSHHAGLPPPDPTDPDPDPPPVPLGEEPPPRLVGPTTTPELGPVGALEGLADDVGTDPVDADDAAPPLVVAGVVAVGVGQNGNTPDPLAHVGRGFAEPDAAVNRTATA